MYTINPGQTAELIWELDIKDIGPFEIGCDLFVYGEFVQAIAIVVRGLGVATRGQRQ